MHTMRFRFGNPSSTLRNLSRALLGAGLAATLALAGCGGDDIDRGPTTIPVTAKLNGIYWDAGDSKLYLTDDSTNSIKVWDGERAFNTQVVLPPAPASGATLGQLTRTSDGTFYTTRFGFGTDGTVVAAPKSGLPFNLSGLDALRRRIGLTVTPDGALLDGWFIKGGAGSISQLTVSGTSGAEQELITGLGKPVGLAVVGDRILVTDQNNAKVMAYSLAQARVQPLAADAGQVIATFTTLDGLDLMTSAADGHLYMGGSGGSLYQINSNTGAVKTLATGWPGIRGVAVDADHRRLFVAVSSAAAGEPASIRILPLD